jgi:hypothetical protein
MTSSNVIAWRFCGVRVVCCAGFWVFFKAMI